MSKIYFSKVREGAKIPQKREEDAGYDIYPCFEEEYMFFYPHETKLVPTGIASAFDSDYYFQIFDRGGTGAKGIHCFSGVIDSGFRGEWFIAWHNSNNYPVIISKDKDNSRWTGIDRDTIFYPYTKAIAQAVLLPVPKTTIEEIDYNSLKEFKSLRGENMLGSTDSHDCKKDNSEENPFIIYRDKILLDLTKAHTHIENHKMITLNFTGEIDFFNSKEVLGKVIFTNLNLEGNSICYTGVEYVVEEVSLEEKTITFKGEKIHGIFPCTCTLKYNPEIMHLNFY